MNDNNSMTNVYEPKSRGRQKTDHEIQRDQELIRDYLEAKELAASLGLDSLLPGAMKKISDKFQLTPQRVYQILEYYDVSRDMKGGEVVNG